MRTTPSFRRPRGWRSGLPILLLAACGAPAIGLDPVSPSVRQNQASAAARRAGLTIGLALDVGGRSDGSYNAMAGLGADRAAGEHGVKIVEVAATRTDTDGTRVLKLRQLLTNGAKDIVAVGNGYRSAVDTLAEANPGVRFALVDGVPLNRPNVITVTFANEEGSYLVGAAAAEKTKTNRIGFVGGMQSQVIDSFRAGYIAGAKAVNPKIVVDTAYLSSGTAGFADIPGARVAAARMYAAGDDIVYQAAGSSGMGVFEAAKSAGKLAIGVDTDQFVTAPTQVRDVILTSMIKRVDYGVEFFVKVIVEGAFRPGVERFDLKSGGLEVATSGGRIDDIVPRLGELRDRLISGEIVAPSR